MLDSFSFMWPEKLSNMQIYLLKHFLHFFNTIDKKVSDSQKKNQTNIYSADCTFNFFKLFV